MSKTELAQSVEIECIPLKSCPTVMKLIFTKKYAPETIEFLKRSHCGFDERRQPKVWCAKFNFCTTPDNRNGKILKY
ncbi:hypothetical protein NQ314_013500 [Rhamnusium bicolor]|uniref:Clip domain-containing protein n=1 Tax=Rhamnusium bicolor TaxID=1586634 RepID=A0AAV8X700_9CUCU|nr:hypothetical protein NQ314_013500 [Rhamnusium bicolor]